jgi:hypothetical protein
MALFGLNEKSGRKENYGNWWMNWDEKELVFHDEIS